MEERIGESAAQPEAVRTRRSLGIGGRLILSCVGLYFAVACLFTVVEALVARSSARTDTSKQIASLAAADSPVLAQAFWNLDMDIIKPLLQGLAANSAVGRVELRDARGNLVVAMNGTAYLGGQGDDDSMLANDLGASRSYPLLHATAFAEEEQIGNLIIFPSLYSERKRTIDAIRVGIGSRLAVVVLLSAILALMTERLLGRPLRDIASQISDISASELGLAARMIPPGSSRGEFALVAEAFNAMAARVGSSLSALGDSERRLRSLFEDSPISIWEEDFSKVKRLVDRVRAGGVRDWDAYFEPEERIRDCVALVRVIDVNRAALQLLGYSSKEEAASSLPKSLDERTIPTWRDELVALASGKSSYEGEARHRNSSGKRIAIQLKLTIVPGFEEDWSRVIASIIDLSERKRVEEALVASEAKFRGLVEQSSEGIILLDSRGSIVDCNVAMELISGQRKESILGKEIWRLERDLSRGDAKDEECPEERQKLWEAILRGEAPEEGGGRLGSQTRPLETRFLGAGGALRVIEITVFPVSTGDGLMTGGVLRDVTERRAAAQALMDSLREKELLLQEVHHRVKNNLQIICSLINLQLNEVLDSPSTSRSLMDMEARVRSMSLVHEILYQSGDFALVDFAAYIGQLCDHLFQAYLVKPDRIRLALSIESVSLPLDKAIPCGLLVNELVVNSLKHAFPDGRAGSIAVEMRDAGGGLISLTVKDDGVGVPQEELGDESRGTIGLSLVKNLTAQLGGSCELSSGDGLRARVLFPA